MSRISVVVQLPWFRLFRGEKDIKVSTLVTVVSGVLGLRTLSKVR